MIVRVLPDAAAIGKAFDYLWPERWPPPAVGTMVRVELHGRRVGGWVVAVGVDPPPGKALRPVAKVRGRGPDAAMVELCRWAAWRWAGPVARLLGTASPARAVTSLPPPGRWSASPAGGPEGSTEPAAGAGTTVVRLGPAADRMPVVEAAVARGPALVLVPGAADAERLAARLRRADVPVALAPAEWAAAAAGGRVVVGTRAAAFSPVPGLAAVAVLDAHDESYRSEAAPTWSAVAVAEERARRAGVPCTLVSPVPPVELLHGRRLVEPARQAELAGWPLVEVVDRRGDDPRTGLWSERVAALVRSGRVVCVLNRTGRARLLACRSCGETAACERCGAAVAEPAGERPPEVRRLACRRCGHERPWACQTCGSAGLRALRVGVTRAREELEALAGRPVVEVTAAGPAEPAGDLLIGTEAVLHRAGRGWDAVCFVDLDQELLAPRVGAAEQALALLARAARLVGPRRGGGRLVLQTRLPHHPVVVAAAAADPAPVAAGEVDVRSALGWPPFGAVARLSGQGAPEVGAALEAALGAGAASGPGPDGSWLVRAGDHQVLCDALASVPRPAARVRVEVDPPRL